MLQDLGLDVTIYTKALPPDTTSNVAGGLCGVLVSMLDNGRAGLAIAAALLTTALVLFVLRRRRRVIAAHEAEPPPARPRPRPSSMR